MFRKLTFLRGRRRLLHGGRETGPHCGQGAGVCASVSSCSALRCGPGQREAEEGFPVLASGSLPCASCQEGTCRAGHPARGHQGRSETPGIAGSLDTHMQVSSVWSRETGHSQTWLWHVEGSSQLWLRCLTAARSCVQLDFSLCLGEIHGTLCSLWSAGASEGGCIYWLRARQPVVNGLEVTGTLCHAYH